jgi:Tfp pilus assembly protein PilF
VEKSVERTQRTFLRLTFGSLAAITALIALLWGGHDMYARWQERRLVQRAVNSFHQGDYRAASLAARTALNLKPNSVGASRVMAQIGERAGDRGALDWRAKIVQILPKSAEDILEWARSAVLFNDLATAERALTQVPESARGSAGHHAVAALVAQGRHEDEKAEKEWEQAARLSPNEHAYQLQYGMLELRSTDPLKRSEGEKTLQKLRADPQQRISATRALITEGVVQHRPGYELVDLARELQTYPEANVSDRILYLDFMSQVQDPQFASYLTQLEKTAAESPVALTQLLSWMSIKNMNMVAVDFLKTVRSETLNKWPVPLAVADVYLHLQDWPELVAATKDASWKQDFLRHAFLAHALRAQDKPALAEREWAAAVKEASNDSSSLISLISLVSQWRWETETVALLWTLTKHPEKQNEAIGTLYRHYAKESDTQGLYRVLLRLAESDPSNLDVQNNLAQISLLLNAQPEDARRMATVIYQKKPTNPAYAATYAYALLTKGQVSQATKVMNSLSGEQLREPAVSAYYGICLAAAKDPRAHEFLEIGKTASLLPEEKALVEKALGHMTP